MAHLHCVFSNAGNARSHFQGYIDYVNTQYYELHHIFSSLAAKTFDPKLEKQLFCGFVRIKQRLLLL